MSGEGEAEDNILEPLGLPPTVPAIETAVVEYTRLAHGIALMRFRVQNVVHDLTTTKGNRDARRDRALLVRARNLLDERRNNLNREDRERISRRNTEAARLTALITELETPLDASIKADEERREREKQAREAAERVRVDELQARVDGIRGLVMEAVGASASAIRDLLDQAERLSIDESFAEFQTPAARARDDALGKLRALYASAFEKEERERLEAEARAENQRQDGMVNAYIHGLGGGLPDDLDAELCRVVNLDFPAGLEELRASRAREARLRRMAALEQESYQRLQEAENRRLREEAQERERNRLIDERRVKVHRDKLTAWRDVPAQVVTANAQQLERLVRDWSTITVGPEWEEFADEARQVLDGILKALAGMLDTRRASESQEAELDRQRAEIERQAKELSKRRIDPPPVLMEPGVRVQLVEGTTRVLSDSPAPTAPAQPADEFIDVDKCLDIVRGICDSAVWRAAADGWLVSRESMTPAFDLVGRTQA